MSKSLSLPFLPHSKTTRSPRKAKLKPSQSVAVYHNPVREDPFQQTRSFLYKTMDRPSKETDSAQLSIGPKAKLEYMNTYRHRLKISDRNSYSKLESSPSAAYLEIIDKQKLNPVPFGIVRNTGKESEVDIHGYFMGDNYALAFSEGVKQYKTLEKVNLDSNRLSEKGLHAILQQLNYHSLKELCLSNNRIGLNSIRKISDVLIDSKSNLRNLGLESTGLIDSSAEILIEALGENSSVTRVNFAKNSLTEKSARGLSKMLKNNSTLRRLDLHWNQLTGRGCALIFEGLEINTKLEELDLSWNLMIRNLNNEAIQLISKVLSGQKYLKHLDLSFNYLTFEYCGFIAEGLKSNHELLGIHMIGNDCTVNSEGFVIANSYINKLEQGHLNSRILSEKSKKNHVLNNCWLCEKWVEMKFIFKDSSEEPICLHLQSNDFQPDLMRKEKNYYTITKVVPPGKVNFFFSANLAYVKSKYYVVEKLKKPIEKQIFFWSNIKDTLTIHSVNQCEAVGVIYNAKEDIKTRPRIFKDTYSPPEVELEKIPWSISISLFKNYQLDTEELLDSCFEFDWKHSRIPNIIKDLRDIDRTKSFLRKHYMTIKDSYKTLSAYSGSEIPCIGSNTLTEFLSQCNTFDSLYAISDFGVNWNISLAPSIKNQLYNPGNALVRYEFLEILTRIANDRYLRTKTLSSLYDSTKTFLCNFLLPKLTSLCSYTWRNTRYLCEITDITLKAHKQLLEAIFFKFSGRKSLPGQKPFMSLEEFRELLTTAGFINDLFSTREIDVCFAQAMMTQVDEIFSKRHTEMRFVEFLEAFTRACDIAAIGRDEEQLEFKEKELSLQKKIENGAKLLIALCPQSVQESFVFPSQKTYEKMMYRPKQRLMRTATINLLEG